MEDSRLHILLYKLHLLEIYIIQERQVIHKITYNANRHIRTLAVQAPLMYVLYADCQVLDIFDLTSSAINKVRTYHWVDPSPVSLFLSQNHLFLRGASYVKHLRIENGLDFQCEMGALGWEFSFDLHDFLYDELNRKDWMIRIRVFCWDVTSQHTRGYARGQRVLQQLPSHWRKRSERGRSLLAGCGEHPFCFSSFRVNWSKWFHGYNVSSVAFANVDDVAEGGDNVDIDAAAWEESYPSSEILFWNDIEKIYIRITPYLTTYI